MSGENEYDETEAVMSVTQEERDARYVEIGGTRCPICWSEAIEGHEVRIEGGSAFQDINCIDCGAGWTDEYVLATIHHE